MAAGNKHQGLKPFVPAWLDELELSTTDFRVLAHLWRRADKRRVCWPAAPSIAKVCRLNQDTVWSCLKRLEARGLVRRGKRNGTTNGNEYTLLIPVESPERKGLLATPESPERKGWRSPETKGRESAESRGQEGIPLKEVQEGRVASPLSTFDRIISEVEAMTEFQDRADVRAIAEIVGVDRIRNAAHLASRVRSEYNPKRKSRARPQQTAEPAGWQEWLADTYPGCNYLPGGLYPATSFSTLPSSIQSEFLTKKPIPARACA